MLNKIPRPVIEIVRRLEAKGFEAFVVGGCVRDLLMGINPKDWDVTTNAKPEEVMKIFSSYVPKGTSEDRPGSFYENKFGTVGVKIPKLTNQGSTFPLSSAGADSNSSRSNLSGKYDVVEVTTYRIESKYSDKRHPDEVRFAKTLEEDLSRRDFTINAMALKIRNPKFEIRNKFKSPKSKIQNNFEIIDFYNGREDLKNKIIRAVGDPNERFDEDALRMMRAVRFAITLAPAGAEALAGKNKERIRANSGPRKLSEETPFTIEPKTFEAIKKNAKNLKLIATERIQDELNKILISDYAAEGIELLRELKLLPYILPELEKGVGVSQNRHHIYTIYEHSVLSLKNCPSPKLEVRLATLLHDIAKPETKRGEGAYSTFYNHDHVGARVVEKILKRLKYSGDIIRKVKLLVDNHMFYYNVDEVGASSVRRLVQRVGLENIDDLIDLRVGDRLGSGVPKAIPYKLRHFRYMVDRVSKDPLSVKMLKVNGNDLMKELKLGPGPKIGAILDVLLSEVMDEPKKNKKELLLARAKDLTKENLPKLREMAKEKIEERKEEEDQEIKAKYWVK